MDLTKLSEKVPNTLPDSLTEIAIEMQDGGDGIFDDQDQFLFSIVYACICSISTGLNDIVIVFN
jgi:hypothetical protein